MAISGLMTEMERTLQSEIWIGGLEFMSLFMKI
jgi:hypothetical protein